MSDLIAALQILLKYGDPYSPTVCVHDDLVIAGISPAEVTDDDRAELQRLGFRVTTGYGDPCFASFRFGSA